MVDEACKVLEHVDMGAGYRRMLFDAPKIAAEAQPGQFVHLRVPALEASALRRPFSIFDARDGRVELLYKTVGRGTAALNAVREGDEVRVMGPLGHGFPLKCEGAALLVGGGFGVAPLYFLARRLLQSNNQTIKQSNNLILFVGGRTKVDLLALDRFEALGEEVRAATNDGSAGVKGLVTDPLDDELIALRTAGRKFEIFACGP
ncbi:MAG: dihydroorotate dehydrogenase electron transfer subunit, partial [Kiritimatiellae bacterium]|nr:dihydroorotate dehydrogenase electron transfer subunit [Kiritimatiellia bacterium]